MIIDIDKWLWMNQYLNILILTSFVIQYNSYININILNSTSCYDGLTALH